WVLQAQGLSHAGAPGAAAEARPVPHPPKDFRTCRAVFARTVLRMTAKRQLGDFGERVARHHLEARGFAVTAANVRLPAGEIDLLAHDGSDLVFVEVRTRRAGAGSAAETI